MIAVARLVRPVQWLLKGAVGGTGGFVVGAALVAGIRGLTGADPLGSGEVLIAGGYLFSMAGWLLGVGVWDFWARRWVGKPLREYRAEGWHRYLAFDTDHKVIGSQYLLTFLGIFFGAGLLAILMRAELFAPGRDLMSPSTYNTVMSLHGTAMIFVAVITTVGGFGNYFLPLMIGAEDMAYPKLNALSYWLLPPVVVMLVASFFAGGYDTGWTGYAPLSVVNASGELFYNLAFFTAGLSSILGSINFLATIVTMRAPGMTWGRLPIFVWSMLATAGLALIFTQFIGLAMLMVVLDRVVGTSFFAAEAGGDPLLYQHVFWFYSHPAVYIMVLPGLGLTLELLAHFSRKPLFGYRWAVGGILGITGMSMLVWAHHMFTSGMPAFLLGPFLASTELISIPTGLVFLSALGTIWRGRLWLTTPMLFALAAIFNFLIGGITGIFLADVPTDLHLQDTYFVVGHFHYTIVGAAIFALFGGIYYWFPKMTGRMYRESLGKLHFWWMFAGFSVTFIPMFFLGMSGMNRRIADYPAVFGDTNALISTSGFLFGAGFLVFLGNVLLSWARGPAAEANPWRARTLEWQTSSPPPPHNFPAPPQVTGGPYDYGVVGSVHARVAPAPAGGAE